MACPTTTIYLSMNSFQKFKNMQEKEIWFLTFYALHINLCGFTIQKLIKLTWKNFNIPQIWIIFLWKNKRMLNQKICGEKCHVYICQIIALFIHCNEPMKISKSLQWNQWNCKWKKFDYFGPNPRFFLKKWPLLWSFIAFLMHTFFKIFQFQVEKNFQEIQILESGPKLA